MEYIKSDFDKMLAKFNDSVTHSAPKKLSFEFNDSLNVSGTVPKKRRISQTDDSPVNGCSAVSSSSLNSSNAAPPSPWETRRLKVDLIEARTMISKLKVDIERQCKLRTEMMTLYENQVTELQKQCEFSSSKIMDLEEHMISVRKREYSAKQEATKLQNELDQQKHYFEEAISNLEREKMEADDNARQVENSMANELGEYRRHVEKVELELDLLGDELSTVKEQLTDFKERATAYDELKLDFEKQQQDLEQANSRIKELENEIASYDDWKEIIKNSQARLLSIPDLDKELERLRNNNKHLQELLGNKLLLEEQVHDLKTRLEREEGARSEVVATQVKLTHMEQELKEWVKIAQDHCLPNMLVSPMALRARIEQLLQNDIILASEKKTNLSETKVKESQLLDYKQKYEIYAKNVEELNTALKRHKIFKERVQRKLLLVSKERDCYKQLLENFEKDLTISNALTTDMTHPEAQLRFRLDMLEKTLMGYKDMCVNLERELTHATQLPQNPDQSVEQTLNSEGYEHFKRELDTLRMENERLRRRKEELELELEHRYLRGDFNCSKYKVVHLKNNPAAEAYEHAENLVEKLQAEIERLKRRNQKLEEDNEATQTRLNDTNLTMNMKDLNKLRAELDTTNAKLKKMKEYYKCASMEFRDVCYMLFGYKIDRVGLNTYYKLSSMYAESPDDYLNFRLNESNVLDMLETPYLAKLKPLMESQLEGNKSLPAFLSALTLELFQRTTVTIS